MAVATTIVNKWLERLQTDLPDQSQDTHTAIAQWLCGEDTERLETLSHRDLSIATQAMDYRYRIFYKTYWGLAPDRAYQTLMRKLGGLFLVRSKIRTWIALSRDRQRQVKDVLQEIIQEMLQSDRHLQQQMRWIAQCTKRPQLRNILTMATIEEYCLRPIRNQPLIVYRFVNYLRRSQRGGMTQVPGAQLIQLISEEIGTDESDSTISLFDVQAVGTYEKQQDFEATQQARQSVKDSFVSYLEEALGDTAIKWLELHLQGYTQDSIAKQLELSINQVYRLREKISYHAIRIFTLKEQPELVLSWLKTTLTDHNLGLTPTQWEAYWQKLEPSQQQLLSELKDGQDIDAIAQKLGCKSKQVMGEWAKLYLAAQNLRT
ncbi:HetZ-related protein 2 [Leptothoe kymatousa]|uniref:HetZ-related protein 2 n=1 Tax=Leptothoe kymatousa TAU-MAC 1615 TaxID=2364775 RepID=A0ABS5Y315_9CYAN|nr:HetZ-related protein 2 [Leptothoe kymatousa]MBT9311380.1 HetZ-related protein 2 [Leptothoe kymatousa TAU-MAC 1615]